MIAAIFILLYFSTVQILNAYESVIDTNTDKKQSRFHTVNVNQKFKVLVQYADLSNKKNKTKKQSKTQTQHVESGISAATVSKAVTSNQQL